MSRTTHASGSLKVKVAWLAAAFVVVWMSAPAGSVIGDGSGVVGHTPTVAAASISEDGTALSGSGVDVAPAERTSLQVRLAKGRSAESEGVRIGVLAVVDQPMPLGVAQEAGEREVWVYVALGNHRARDITYTALDLELTDGRDYFSSVEGRRGPGPMLRFGVLAPGEVTSGWRIFRVPADAGPFHLVCSAGRVD